MKSSFFQLDKFHRRLLAMIASEVKVPIANALYLLKMNKEKTGQEDSQFLETLEKHMAASHSLLSELLAWSKTYFIPSTSIYGMLSLNSLTDEVSRFVSEHFPKPLICFCNKIPAGFVLSGNYIEAYRFVLRNILTLAARYTASDTIIVIQARLEEDYYIVSISMDNTGPLFQLVENALSYTDDWLTGVTHEEEAGFGLLLCRDCLQELDCRFWVEPASSNHTELCFTLPVIKFK